MRSHRSSVVISLLFTAAFQSRRLSSLSIFVSIPWLQRTFGVLKNFTSFVTPGRLEQPTISHVGIFVVGNQNGARAQGSLQHLFCDVT